MYKLAIVSTSKASALVVVGADQLKLVIVSHKIKMSFLIDTDTTLDSKGVYANTSRISEGRASELANIVEIAMDRIGPLSCPVVECNVTAAKHPCAAVSTNIMGCQDTAVSDT